MSARALLLAIALSCTGCASIVHGTTQSISIQSQPSAANVTVDGAAVGVTPLLFDMKRKSKHIVTISKPNYVAQWIVISRAAAPATFGNVLVGGFIGLGVDAASGAMFNLEPNEINAVLVPMALEE